MYYYIKDIVNYLNNVSFDVDSSLLTEKEIGIINDKRWNWWWQYYNWASF